MSRFLVALISLSLVSSASHAVTLQECHEAGVDLTDVVLPASKNSRSFSQNAVGVFNIDIMEPAAAAAGLAIVLPDNTDELGLAKCYAVTGLSSINIMTAVASYDAGKGLLLTVPGRQNIDGENTQALTVRIRINQKNSTVTLE